MGVAVGSGVAVGVEVGSGVGVEAGVAVGVDVGESVGTAVGSDVPKIAKIICEVIGFGLLSGCCAIPRPEITPNRTSSSPSILGIMSLA